VESGEPEINEFTCCSVWYAWTAPESGWVDVSIANTGGLLGLSVQQGTAVDQLTEIAPIGTDETFHATVGQVYDFQVRGAWHTFDLQYSEIASPANDDFGDAQSITGGEGPPASVSGTTLEASTQTGEPNTPADTRPSGTSGRPRRPAMRPCRPAACPPLTSPCTRARTSPV
jgi:hypothetical protein